MFTSYVQIVVQDSSSCDHTSSKSLSPLSNSFVDDALIQLIPFYPIVSHSSWMSLILQRFPDLEVQ